MSNIIGALSGGISLRSWNSSRTSVIQSDRFRGFLRETRITSINTPTKNLLQNKQVQRKNQYFRADHSHRPWISYCSSKARTKRRFAIKPLKWLKNCLSNSFYYSTKSLSYSDEIDSDAWSNLNRFTFAPLVRRIYHAPLLV
jgi:hypothetical protein